MRKKITIFSFLLIALLTAVFILKKDPESVVQGTPKEKPEKSDYINISIVTSDKPYGVGEEFFGEYVFEYRGDSFPGILLYSKWMKGYEEKAIHERISGTVRHGDLNLGLSLFRREMKAFYVTEEYVKDEERHFSSPGEYVYTVSLFDCSQMGLSEKGCLARLPASFLFKFDPVERVSKIVVVGGETDYIQKNVVDCKEDEICLSQIESIFKDRIESCYPSKGTFVIYPEKEIFGVSRNYRIIGKDNGECVIIFSYITEEEIDFPFILEKEMTCRYTEQEANMEFILSIENCTGPLYDEMETFFKNTDG